MKIKQLFFVTAIAVSIILSGCQKKEELTLKKQSSEEVTALKLGKEIQAFNDMVNSTEKSTKRIPIEQAVYFMEANLNALLATSQEETGKSKELYIDLPLNNINDLSIEDFKKIYIKVVNDIEQWKKVNDYIITVIDVSRTKKKIHITIIGGFQIGNYYYEPFKDDEKLIIGNPNSWYSGDDYYKKIIKENNWENILADSLLEHKFNARFRRSIQTPVNFCHADVQVERFRSHTRIKSGYSDEDRIQCAESGVLYGNSFENGVWVFGSELNRFLENLHWYFTNHEKEFEEGIPGVNLRHKWEDENGNEGMKEIYKVTVLTGYFPFCGSIDVLDFPEEDGESSSSIDTKNRPHYYDYSHIYSFYHSKKVTGFKALKIN